MTSITIHRGGIVEKAARRSGHSLTKLAKKLGIGRNTLYYKFKDANLTYKFIMEVGRVIHYDFTLDFPEMKVNVGLLEKDQVTELWRIKRKYAELLEKHTKLLAILANMANENELSTLQQEIAKILEKENKESQPYFLYL